MAAAFRILMIMIFLTAPAIASAQGVVPPSLPRLSGPQKRTLLLIAREAIDASLEGRSSREATVEPRLTVAQPLVVSIYVDDKLRGRAWSLKGESSLHFMARDLTYEAISSPRVSRFPLAVDELARARVSIAVLSGYTRANDDSDVPSGSAVIIYNGFTEWMALPDDIESTKAADLLDYACEQAGLRPHVWLLPQTVIYSAGVEQSSERQ